MKSSGYSYFEKGCRKKVHATILKGIVGDFKCTVFQRNLKESYGRPLIYVCECWRKVTKVGSTATVVRNSVLIISQITFQDCRVHFTLDKLSRNSCMYRKLYERECILWYMDTSDFSQNCTSRRRVPQTSAIWEHHELVVMFLTKKKSIFGTHFSVKHLQFLSLSSCSYSSSLGLNFLSFAHFPRTFNHVWVDLVVLLLFCFFFSFSFSYSTTI